MLFVLTGDIQTGKTRWLERLVHELTVQGATAYGVVAPGVWRADGAGGFEKLGIDNVLLPAGERVHLARRRDLAAQAGALAACGQSEAAGLGWAMDDASLARVDAHFEALSPAARPFASGSAAASPAPAAASGAHPGLLVVDELGRLELLRGAGLVHAVALLRCGPCERWGSALAVVRRDLLGPAHRLLDGAWGDVVEIGPDDASRDRVLRAVLGGKRGYNSPVAS